MEKKINLIDIASIGRSGTTLFESMLGAHTDIVTSGEMQLWPHEIMEGGVLPTGSGEYVQDCLFWQEMERRVNPLEQPEPQIHHFRETHHAGRTLRLSRLKDFASGPLPDSVAAQIQQYGENNYKLFRNFLDLVEEKTGHRPTWVVDASKDPYRLLWLARSGFFNIKVFHLVRDPRGFIFSVTKQWLKQDIPFRNTRRLYYTIRQSLAWVIRNHLYRRIGRHHIDLDDYMLVQYEQLATKPHYVFEQACNLVDCPYEPGAVDDFRDGSPFAMAGNPMRHDDRPIQLDERWKSQLPYSSRLLAHMITALTRDRFGYA
jgi:hypothetical protein